MLLLFKKLTKKEKTRGKPFILLCNFLFLLWYKTILFIDAYSVLYKHHYDERKKNFFFDDMSSWDLQLWLGYQKKQREKTRYGKMSKAFCSRRLWRRVENQKALPVTVAFETNPNVSLKCSVSNEFPAKNQTSFYR